MSDQSKDNTSVLRNRVLDAYTELIREHLDSTQPYRFKTIIKLCESAHQLAKLGAIKVEDVMRGVQGEEMGVRYHAMQEGIGMIGGRRQHENDQVREMIHQIGSLFEQANKDSNEKLLDRLGRVRDVLLDMGRPEAVAVIENKIDEVVVDMQRQEGLEDDAVVPTEFLRGHQAEGQERRQLRAGSGAADGEGEGSAGAVPEERGEEGVDRHEVRSHPSNGAGRHSWTDPQGAGVASETPQAKS